MRPFMLLFDSTTDVTAALLTLRQSLSTLPPPPRGLGSKHRSLLLMVCTPPAPQAVFRLQMVKRHGSMIRSRILPVKSPLLSGEPSFAALELALFLDLRVVSTSTCFPTFDALFTPK